MSMRTLVYENCMMTTFTAGGGALPTVTLTSPRIRPRLQGYAGAIRGPAREAMYVDRPAVVFDFRPAAALVNFTAVLTITRFEVLGQIFTPIAAATRDITGEFILARGNYEVDMNNEGVAAVSLTLTNNAAVAQLAALTTQVFGEVSVRQLEREVIDGVHREPGV